MKDEGRRMTQRLAERMKAEGLKFPSLATFGVGETLGGDRAHRL
jgi:hypothetical protein